MSSQDIMKCAIFLLFQSLVTYDVVVANDCSRHQSRIARKNLEKNFFPKFQNHAYVIPDNCAWNPAKDIYLNQEQNKEVDELGRAVCNFCGKIFVSEYHIDLHMTNRHQQHILKDGKEACLADYCDILRCDILSGDKRTGYWDEALCNEAQLKQLRDSCEKHVRSCVPDHLEEDKKIDFIAELIDSTCSALTCDKFYESGLDKESVYSSTVYIILFVVLGTGLVLYYTVAIIHFFTDDSFIKETDEYSGNYSQRKYTAPVGSEIRNRYPAMAAHR
ncbi:uncharacterized protein LOC117117380 [Anneissia japonica]|uniref:uncharacterized protein LOC117117380 n=1 Tax=Anneissia japonica TaxID=1529436 RepID=UPI0014258994|nr:uncharacterized protein LOC117117380 [Anneissia japonica]